MISYAIPDIVAQYGAAYLAQCERLTWYAITTTFIKQFSISTVMMKENGETSGQFKIDSSMKIGYVSLNVSNLSRSLDFYQSILGFKAVTRPSSGKALLSIDGNNSYLVELLQAKADTNDGNLQPATAKRAGLYHFAILLPERKFLADMLQNLRDERDRVHFDGLADHLVSESIYIRDPDFNGIEIYRDRPAPEWNWNGNRLEMATLQLDTNDLLRESTDKGWEEMPPKTTIGHVHLHASNLARATKFYREILGLNLTLTFHGASFFAAGKYHHHIATNTWLGTDIRPASPEGVGLNHFSIELPSKEAVARITDQLSRYGLYASDLPDGSFFVQDMDGIKMRVRHK
jgi:catechol 2,3-dioxygenase